MIPLSELTKIQCDVLKMYPTYKDFFADFNPSQLLVNFDEIESIQQSVSRRRMAVSDIQIIYQEPNRNLSVEYIIKWLDFLNDFLNINKKLTETRSVAYMIYKSYGHLFLSDFKLVFEKITYGEYGPFYGSVDAQRILYGFMQYNIERKALIQKNRVKLELELEKHLDQVAKMVDNQVREKMKLPPYSDLVGQDYYQQKNTFVAELLPSALTEAREKFITEYENKLTNGKN